MPVETETLQAVGTNRLCSTPSGNIPLIINKKREVKQRKRLNEEKEIVIKIFY
jgi:hypothetical protein